MEASIVAHTVIWRRCRRTVECEIWPLKTAVVEQAKVRFGTIDNIIKLRYVPSFVQIGLRIASPHKGQSLIIAALLCVMHFVSRARGLLRTCVMIKQNSLV